MENLLRHLKLPCGFLRMLLMSAIVTCASCVAGDGVLWALSFGVASLVLMQVGYFGAILALAAAEKNRRS